MNGDGGMFPTGITTERAPDARCGHSVLVVEDAPAVRDALAAVLELEGYHVTAAGDGREALQILDRLRPNVAILDLQMPGMDGFVLRDEMRRRCTSDVPTIALTGHGSLRQHALRLGFSAALQKPCDMAMLLSLVAHHCRAHPTAKKRGTARSPGRSRPRTVRGHQVQ
jgi:CheY-like chemotaxis protein